MRHIAILFAVILFVSCTNDNMYMSDNDNDYWSKEQLLNTSGLGLYPFVPFTEAEMRTLPYDVKLERRQIPESFLRNMSTKALFYQFVYTDLSKSMLMFNTMQQGFETVTGQLNMLPVVGPPRCRTCPFRNIAKGGSSKNKRVGLFLVLRLSANDLGTTGSNKFYV